MTTADLAATREFYSRLFDFELVEKGIYQGTPWNILRSGNSMLCLYEHPAREPAVTFGDHKTQAVNHFGFSITDEQPWLDRLSQVGIIPRYGGAVRRPHSRSWYVIDPSDYEIVVTLWDNNQIRFPEISSA